jgi:hypothetical protein
VMWQEETVAVLRQLGFAHVAIPYRDNQHAVLVATKPQSPSAPARRVPGRPIR